jgi:hypothetical protein
MHLRRLLVLTLLPACVLKPSDGGDGDAGGGDASGGTLGAEDTGGGTDASTTGSDEPTGGSVPPNMTVPTGDGTTDDSPTSEDPPEPDRVALCEALCERAIECEADGWPPLAECVADCVDDTHAAVCADKLVEAWACLAGLTCEALLATFDGEPGECAGLFADFAEGCAQAGCDFAGGGDFETFCTVQQTCGEVTREYSCMQETCQCLENGEPGASCPAEGLCLMEDVEAQILAAEACCGWDL